MDLLNVSFKFLLRPDIYYEAYRNLYANNGATTKGVNHDTADGFSEAKIEKIIKSLAEETYQPKPVRRTYIEKSNSKKKQLLGIPTFTYKLVQEVLKMVLQAVYEPVFLNCSHGFRLNRSCHTALTELIENYAIQLKIVITRAEFRKIFCSLYKNQIHRLIMLYRKLLRWRMVGFRNI